MPALRELVLARHVVFYAHSERNVLLLSLRYQRQLDHRLALSVQPRAAKVRTS